VNKISVIFWKEFKGFVLSPTFYIVGFLIASIMSWVYPIALSDFARNMQAMMFQPGLPPQAQNIHYGVFLRHLSNLNLILIFVVPALTMRLFAEEKKLRSLDLLMTSPVTSLQIVVGKYLSAIASIFLLCLIGLSYPVATAALAKFAWAPLLVAFFGIFMVAAVYAAMNLFCSSLTESAIVAYVMAVVLNIGVWFIGLGVEVVDSSWARSIFEHISLNTHLIGLVEGTIRTSSVIFLLSLIFFFCFLCERVVESARWRS
jgi:ABC-2 type transport system permease protein